MLLGLLPAASAWGYPLLAPRPIPSAIAGPADPHVAGIFYNPAAIGPLRGVHLHIEGGARVHLGSIDRAPVEGRPGGSESITWANPDGFVGATWDLSTDSFTIGLAVHAPFTDLTQYRRDSPVRYHATEHSMFILQQTIAAAFKVSSRFFVGAAATFAETWLQYRFARDAAISGGTPGVDQPGGLCGGGPCGLENPLAAQRLRLRGFGWGIGFSVGILVRPVDRLWLGLSYTSHIFNTGRGGDFPLADGRLARITAAPGQGPVCGDPNTCWANNLITVAIPDMIQFATRVEVSSRFDIEGSARWVHYGTRKALDVSVQGGTSALVADTRATQVGPQFLLDRGLSDAFGFEVSGRWKLGDKLRLSPSLFFETSAVETSAVNASSIDAPKFDVALTAEWKPVKHLFLGAHVGGTAYLLSDAGGRFNPRAQVACVDAAYALDACGAANAGQALPAAEGRYTMFVVHVGAAIGFDY